MKLKGISVFEQHIEKVFAAIIFVALLCVLAWQFLGKPAVVTVGKREAQLNQAWDAVAEDARRVQANLDSTRAPEHKDAEAATLPIVKFNDTYRGPLAPSRALAIAIGETPNLGNIDNTPGTSITPLAELVVPAPTSPYGSNHLTLVAPYEAEGRPEVAAVLPPKMPFDKAGVTVEATFDGKELMDSLTADPDGPDSPMRAMPRHWWDGSIQIVDVELEREELTPTGEWTDLKTIEPIPGRTSLRAELANPIEGAAQLKEFARFATEYSDAIRRPPYYASAMGEKWLSPAERREMDDKLAAQQGTADDASRTRRQIEAKQAEMQRVEQQIEKFAAGGGGAPKPPRPSPAPKPGGGAGGKGPGGGGGGGGAGPREPREQPKDTTEDQRKRLENTLTKIQGEIARLIERLRAMGEDVSMYGPQDAGGVPPIDPNSANTPEAALLDNPAVRLWSHDVFVERGKTYRYRLRAVLSNPMFGQGNVMVPEQQDWAKTPVVRSEPSEWSDPVRVDDETYFFITSANAADRLNRTPGAHAELFIFKWGRWRKGDVQLEPGDRLRAEVKYPDVSALIAQLPMGDPGQPAIPGIPQPPAADPGSGGGKRAPTAPPAPSPPPNPSDRDTRRPDGRDPAPPPGGGPRPDPAPGGKPAPLPLLTEKVAVDAIFLSVAAASQAVEANAGARSGTVAYLRDQIGEVVPRYPDTERGSIVLARLARSAKQGMEDFQPNEPKPVEPPRPRPTRPDDIPPGGGGGGGGGSGGG